MDRVAGLRWTVWSSRRVRGDRVVSEPESDDELAVRVLGVGRVVHLPQEPQRLPSETLSTYIYIFIYICTFVCVRALVCVCVCVRAPACACVCVYRRIHAAGAWLNLASVLHELGGVTPRGLGHLM